MHYLSDVACAFVAATCLEASAGSQHVRIQYHCTQLTSP
jgi:hypothetical protein